MAGVRLIIQFTAENAAEVDKEMEERRARCIETAKEPGCLQFEVFRSAVHPEKFVLLEHWESKEALEAHRQRGTTGSNPSLKRQREHYPQQFS
jgi:quinol monooxygenase YgiN